MAALKGYFFPRLIVDETSAQQGTDRITTRSESGTLSSLPSMRDDAMFQVLVSPGTVGADSFVLQLMNGDASPLAAKEATLTLSLPERGIEPMERAATLGPDGYWHVRGVLLPYPGRWHVRIDALVTDFQKITLEDDIDVPAP